jgi:hypothetical protein
MADPMYPEHNDMLIVYIDWSRSAVKESLCRTKKFSPRQSAFSLANSNFRLRWIGLKVIKDIGPQKRAQKQRKSTFIVYQWVCEFQSPKFHHDTLSPSLPFILFDWNAIKDPHALTDKTYHLSLVVLNSWSLCSRARNWSCWDFYNKI